MGGEYYIETAIREIIFFKRDIAHVQFALIFCVNCAGRDFYARYAPSVVAQRGNQCACGASNVKD